MLMVLQPVQVRFEWVYAELLWIYLLNTATSFWIRQQRWDVQNIMTLRITLWHIEMRSTVFLNIINLTLLTYTLWISACIYFSCFFCCFFLQTFSVSFSIFFSFYSIFFLSVYPTLTFDFSLLSHSLSKSSVNLTFYTFYCLPTFILRSLALSIQTFDWGSDLRLRAPRRLHISEMDRLLWFTQP